MNLIRQRAPYLSLAEYHGMLDTLGGARARPVYRGHFNDEFLLRDARADGPEEAPQIEAPPMWNRGLMSDNEFMWHGVRATGTPEERAELKAKLTGREKLHYADGGDWQLREDTRVLAKIPEARLRISLLWKAYVFLDEGHLHSFEQRDMDLSHDRVMHLYREDLADKSISVPKGSDLFKDAAWRETLESTYLSAFHAQATGD
jgi:hypothetical protein